MEAEHFSFKMQIFADLQLEKQLQKAPFCSGEYNFYDNIYAVYCAVKLVIIRVSNM